MTLVIIIFATCIVVYQNYKKEMRNDYNEHLLIAMLLTATAIWIVVSIMDLINMGFLVFNQSADVLLNDMFIGFIVVTLSFFIWVLSILIEDRKRVLPWKHKNEDDIDMYKF